MRKVEQLEKIQESDANHTICGSGAILVLDLELKVKSSSQGARDLLKLSGADLDCFVGELSHPILGPEVVEDARRALQELVPVHRDCAGPAGGWFDRRVQAYRGGSRRIAGIMVSFTDMTELNLARERATRREKQQELLARLGRRSGNGLEQFLEHVVHEVPIVLDADASFILDQAAVGESLRLRAGSGWAADLDRDMPVSSDPVSPFGYALGREDDLLVEDLSSDPRFLQADFLEERDMNSAILCHIRHPEGLPGLLVVASHRRAAFTLEDRHFLEAVAAFLSLAFAQHLGRHRRELEEVSERILREATTFEPTALRMMEAIGLQVGAGLAALWLSVPADPELLRCRQFKVLDGQQRPDAVKSLLGELRLNEIMCAPPSASCVNLVTHPTWMPGAARARELGFISVLVVPLSARNQVSGVASFYSRRRLVFDSAFLRGLESTGRHLGELGLRTILEKALEPLPGRS